ncbi:MAG: hypothetical protein MK185_09375 [Saccharospirillaceae bacterium]|nr:hypothetical protein [Saccharospirillaceae bacterium]
MKNLIYLFFLLNACTAMTAERINNQRIIAIYQLDDEEGAAFDFFSSEKLHKCDKEPSGRYRSYSSDADVAVRNFELARMAFEQEGRLSFRPLACEGKAMLVDQMGIQK